MTVKVEKDTDVDEWQMYSTATVSIEILDINDNIPTFASDFYNGTILENSPISVPVTLDYPKDITVYDWDNVSMWSNVIAIVPVVLFLC